VPFQLPTRTENDERNYSKNIVPEFENRKSVLCSGTKNSKDAPGASPRHYGTEVAVALYNQGSGLPVIQMNRIRPGLAHGGRPLKQEIRS
jgi:hypothetical protein